MSSKRGRQKKSSCKHTLYELKNNVDDQDCIDDVEEVEVNVRKSHRRRNARAPTMPHRYMKTY